jgi:ribose transport system permease protein
MALMDDQWQEGAPDGAPSLGSFWSRTTRTKVVNGLLDYGVLLVVIALFIYFSIASPYFLSVQNLLNIGYAASITGILAVGITIALIAGQLDLSIGAMVGLTTVIIATGEANHGLSYGVAIALAAGAALIVGLINGFLVVNVGINSIIVTIAVSTVVFAAGEVVSVGQTIPLGDISLTQVVNARVVGVPVTIILMALAYVAAYVFLIQTRLGWHIYAAGGNPSAAQRAGIRVGSLYRFAFLLTAGLSVIGGVVIAGRAASGGAGYGATLGIDVLTAVLLGGIGLGGGSGRIERTLVGVLLIGVLGNGLVLTNVTSYYQDAATGVIFVAAVVMAAVRAKRMSR